MTKRPAAPANPRSGPVRGRAWVLSVLLLAACGGGPPDIPDPRPIVIYSGARIRVEPERMREINDWVTREQTNITEDPSFLVETRVATEQVYPWENMTIEGDTVRVYVDPRAPDTRLVHEIYGHLHLMVEMGRQEEWLPEAPDATGFALERAILARAAEAWLLGRTTFDTAPYGPLDELMWANEDGYLDAFVFTARPDQFTDARIAWARENPGASERYRSWFLETFNREPPGMRTN